MIDRSVITFIILVVVTTIVICIVSYIISKLIVAPLQTVSRMMERAKEGDLTVHGDYTAKDELGVLVSNFNEMIAAKNKYARSRIIFSFYSNMQTE